MKGNLFNEICLNGNIINLILSFICVRWYLKYALSYRDLSEIMQERGLFINHTTIHRWVKQYAPI
jgi:transposase-like protein